MSQQPIQTKSKTIFCVRKIIDWSHLNGRHVGAETLESALLNHRRCRHRWKPRCVDSDSGILLRSEVELNTNEATFTGAQYSTTPVDPSARHPGLLTKERNAVHQIPCGHVQIDVGLVQLGSSRFNHKRSHLSLAPLPPPTKKKGGGT